MKNRSDWDDYELPEEYDFSGKEAMRGRFYSPKKKSVTIRLDDDVVLYFRKLAGIKKVGYQSLINAALRERMITPIPFAAAATRAFRVSACRWAPPDAG